MVHVWQLTCTVITTIWWRASHVADVHGNYYYMVEGSPHVWQLTCTVNTPIRWRGALTCGSCVAINVHSSYKNMVEGTPHMWAINVHANY